MQNMESKIIVITPIKNESWILTNFLLSLKDFADIIILGDHNSTDESLIIAKSFSKVTIVTTPTSNFDEAARRNILLEKAREFGENNFILALDADEIISPSFLKLNRNEFLRNFYSGERLYVNRFNLIPGSFDYWVEKIGPIGFIDDGSSLDPQHLIHFSRVPETSSAKKYFDESLFIIHVQALNENRFFLKQSWYILWECIFNNHLSFLKIYRRYEYLNNLSILKVGSLPRELQRYLESNGNVTSMLSKADITTYNLDFLSAKATQFQLECYNFISGTIGLKNKPRNIRFIFRFVDKYIYITSKKHPFKRNIVTKVMLHLSDSFLDLFLRFVSKEKIE